MTGTEKHRVGVRGKGVMMMEESMRRERGPSVGDKQTAGLEDE